MCIETAQRCLPLRFGSVSEVAALSGVKFLGSVQSNKKCIKKDASTYFPIAITFWSFSGGALSLAMKHGIQCVTGTELNLILDSINKTAQA